MKIKFILIAIISIYLTSCKKTDVGGIINESAVSIKANNTWFQAGTQADFNRINLAGAGVISFTISVTTIGNVPLECYFSIEDEQTIGTQRTIIKTNPAPKMNWNASTKAMSLTYVLNVATMASGRDYIGHIVINGPAGYHQQTDYYVRR